MNDSTKKYSWQGIDEKGKRVAGEDFARDETGVSNLLFSRKIQPITISVVRNKQKNLLVLLSRPKIKAKEITSFTKSFANTISANIPLATALSFLGNDCDASVVFNNVIIDIKKNVENGVALNEAFRKYPAYFDEFYCDLVRVGEYSGKLDEILFILSLYLEKKQNQKTKIIKALFYPVTVFIVAIVVTSILLIFVVPQFQEMFANFGAALPLYTLFVMSCAAFIKAKIIYIFIFFLLAFFIIRYSIAKYEKVAKYIDSLKLKTPIFGKLLQKIILSRFARILSIMFKSGIPIIDSLSITASVCNNLGYEKAINDVKNKIIKGDSLEKALREVNYFPQKMIHFIAVGEESGRLDDMLFEVARIYEEEVNYILDNLNNLLEPMIMMLLGILVGSVVIAMYLPIFRLGSVI